MELIGRTPTPVRVSIFRSLQFFGNLWIAEAILVEIEQVKAQAMLHFALAQDRASTVASVGTRPNLLRRAPDKRMCPASPQSSTRCATLIPDPTMLVLSLTSVTRLTGPLWMPMRS